MMFRKYIFYIGCWCWLAIACKPSVSASFTESGRLPKIYPDYVDVTVPVNIAPLTFELDEEADEVIARYVAGSEEVVCEGKMQPTMDEWRALTAGGGLLMMQRVMGSSSVVQAVIMPVTPAPR